MQFYLSSAVTGRGIQMGLPIRFKLIHTNLVLLLVTQLLTVGCNKATFDSSQENLSTVDGLGFADTTVYTKKNTPIEFDVQAPKKGGRLSVSEVAGNLSVATSLGSLFLISDERNFKAKYTPARDFIGREEVRVYMTDFYGNFIEGKVTVVVGNSISHIQPALAVRGFACTACHAQVASNILTDLGLSSNGLGNYFALTGSWNTGFYSDHGNGTSSIGSMVLTPDVQVIVPRVAIPDAYKTPMAANTLAEFVGSKLAASNFASTRAATVREMNTVKIKPPTAARLAQVFGNPTERFVFERDNHESPALSGLVYDSANDVFRATNLVCDGDLFINGVLSLEGASVQSVNGCRLYVTKSVFVRNGLQSIPYGASANHNLQIVSSRGVFMGLGSVIKDSVKCETSGWYFMFPSQIQDSFTVRMAHMVSHKAATYEYPNALDLKNLVVADAAKVGPMLDATCEAGGRAKVLSRILVVAPWVQSRYNGNVSGAVIAEAALMSLGQFKFSFDPIFKSTSVLPKLDENEIVSAE